MKRVITAKNAPEAIGPYSHANIFGAMIFTSGQLPVKDGNIVNGGITEQSQQSLLNLKYVLEASHADMTSVVKTTCYLSDINDFRAFNEVYKTFFKADFPARSCFAVKELPMGALIEVEAIACRK